MWAINAYAGVPCCTTNIASAGAGAAVAGEMLPVLPTLLIDSSTQPPLPPTIEAAALYMQGRSRVRCQHAQVPGCCIRVHTCGTITPRAPVTPLHLIVSEASESSATIALPPQPPQLHVKHGGGWPTFAGRPSTPM